MPEVAVPMVAARDALSEDEFLETGRAVVEYAVEQGAWRIGLARRDCRWLGTSPLWQRLRLGWHREDQQQRCDQRRLDSRRTEACKWSCEAIHRIGFGREGVVSRGR